MKKYKTSLQMHFGRLVPLVFVFWSMLTLNTASGQESTDLLLSALIAMFNGLQYMHDHVNEINLDGAFGCRFAAELIRAFVESRPKAFEGRGYALRQELEMLSEKAEKVVEEAKVHIAVKDPQYYEKFGRTLDRSSGRLDFPSRMTNPYLREQPLPYLESLFNSTLSNDCLEEALDSCDNRDQCRLSNRCMEASARLKERGYVITHQVFYLQLAEMKNCLFVCNMKVPAELKDALCANVMRDAEEIANNGFPMKKQDLFMEQIGFCGLWGYRDFYKPEWLRNILQWQQYSGCYTSFNFADGCMSHKTGVALMALAANIRFSIEELSK